MKTITMNTSLKLENENSVSFNKKLKVFTTAIPAEITGFCYTIFYDFSILVSKGTLVVLYFINKDNQTSSIMNVNRCLQRI